MTLLPLISSLIHGHLPANYELDSSGSIELKARGSRIEAGPMAREVGVMVATITSKDDGNGGE